MDDSLISQRFIDRIDKLVDRKVAVELFLKFFIESEGSFQESFQQVADIYKVTISEIEYLYHKDDWAMAIVKKETENALVKQVMSNKTWLQDRDKLYELGQRTIDQLIKDFNENGKLPFDVEVLRKDPAKLDKFVKTMKELSSIQTTGNDPITKSIIINQKNETTINTGAGVSNDRINEILKNEGRIEDGEFLVKKQDKEETDKYLDIEKRE